jgi:hypothetical protein
LEELCKELNEEISTLQDIVTALESCDYIVSAYPLASGDGYTLVFKSGKSIVIYNGKDGVDGITPVISVRKDTDGVYYWTVNGEWLLVDGEKVIASSSDTNGGKYGISSPMFKVENGYWYISCDNGSTWEKFCEAIVDGVQNSDCGFFKEVTICEGYVQIVLNDGNDTIIQLPFYEESENAKVVELEGEICAGNLNTGGGITSSA